MADSSRLRAVVCVVLGLASGACTATIGPYVTDIEEMPDGRWKVIRCTTEVSNIGTSAQGFEQGECTSKLIGQPQPAQPR